MPKSQPSNKIEPYWPRDHYSWSQFHIFVDQGPEEYKKKYLLCPLCGNAFLFKRVCPYCGDVPEYTNARMQTGKMVAEMLEHDTEQESKLMEHLRVFLPRYQHQEFKIETKFNGITLKSFLDGFNEPVLNDGRFVMDPGKIGEYKTGVKWTQAMVDAHRQLDWYVLQAHLKYGVKPESIPIELIWMPTEWAMGDMLPRPTGEIVVFKTRRTMMDCLNIGKKIVDSWKRIGEYCGKEISTHD